MKVQMRGRNLQVPDNVKEYTEKRLSKLDKLIDKEVEAVVTLIEEPRKNYKRVEITIPIGGYVLRGEEEDVDFLSAIDLANRQDGKTIGPQQGTVFQERAFVYHQASQYGWDRPCGR